MSEKLRAELGADKQLDGEFYMSFEDFLRNFDKIDTVYTDLNGMPGTDFTKANLKVNKWNAMQFSGEFVAGKNSGGCGNEDPAAYWTNPQHQIQVPKIRSNQNVSVIISLLQTETVRKRQETDGSYENAFEALSFRIYSIRAGEKPDSKNRYAAQSLELVDKISSYIYQRDVTQRFDLKPNTYVLIPSLFDRNKNMKYILRYFHELDESETNGIDSKTINHSTPVTPLAGSVLTGTTTPNKANLVQPGPGVSSLSEKYDSWYFAGMSRDAIEKHNAMALDNSLKSTNR